MIEPYRRQSALDHLGLAGRGASAPGDAGVTLAEKTLPVAVNLRGKAGDPAFVEAVRGALGLEPPTAPNTVAASDGTALLWLGPDEWLAVQHDAAPGAEAQLAAKLRAALANDAGGQHAAITEVGESLCCIAVAGPRARDLIAKGCPLDLHPRVFGGVGHCAQSHLAKAAITLHQVGDAPAYDLYTRRSFSDYLWRWLEDAGREYGLAIVRP
jgi:sarcosine oxidase subunit gamma